MSGATRTALVRPMTEADIDQVAIVTADAFGTDISTDVARHVWEQRLLHSLRHDAAGSFVSVRERDGVVTGSAQAVIREDIWILSLMAVSPTLGEGGEGRALMQSALNYDQGCVGGLIVASDDPRALRLYASSGFALEASHVQGHGLDRPGADPRPAPGDRTGSQERARDARADLPRRARRRPHPGPRGRVVTRLVDLPAR
jgi:predicted N-acetyltransferase YhbS